MGFFKNSSIKNEPGKRYEDLSMKQEIKERYPNINKEDFLKDLADKNPYHHKDKPPVYEEMDDIDNWEVEEPSKDRELSEDIWNTDPSVDDDYDGGGGLDYFSELSRSKKTEAKYNELVEHNRSIEGNSNIDNDCDEIDISTPEGIIDSIDASYAKEKALAQEKRAEEKIADRKKAKDAKWRLRKMKNSADWYSKEELLVMKEAYENYYQNFLLKSAQRKGETGEFNRLSKLDGKMEISGKIFAGPALKEDAIDYAMFMRRENLDKRNWQKMPGQLLGRLQFDKQHKCLKTYEDTVVKTKDEEGKEVMKDTRIIYTSNRNDRISNVFKVLKKTDDFESHGRQIKIYEVEFQPPFFEKKNNNNNRTKKAQNKKAS